MITNIKVWLLLLILPMLIGTIIYFLVPMQFILSASPKIQEAYNSYKLQVEQYSIRSLAITNAKTVTNNLQMYENLLITLVNHIKIADEYETVNFSPSSLNSAFQIANMNITQLEEINLQKSMWYSGEARIGAQDKEIFQIYGQISSIIEQRFQNRFGLYKGIRKLQWELFYRQKQYYFGYPSQKVEKFGKLGGSVLGKSYNLCMKAYQQTKQIQSTLIHQGDTFTLSTIILDNDQPLGVVSLQIDTLQFMQDLIQTLSVQKFKLSQNCYYLLRPVYEIQQYSSPQIISLFDSQTNNFPSTPSHSYLNITQHQLPLDIFSGKQDYKLYVKKAHQIRNYLSVPISTKNYMGTSSICMYLMLINHFQESNLSEEYFRDIKVSLIVPVSLLFLAASIITSLIIRSHLLRLLKVLSSFINYCSLILKGDTQLEIKYDDIRQEDVRDLFDQLVILNKLSKYSQPKFYTGTKTELIGKYFEAYKFFDQYGYNLANVYENIAECYFEMEEITEACKFIRNAISIDVDLYSQYRNMQRITLYQNKLEDQHLNKMENLLRKKKQLQRNLMRRIHRQILFMHNISHPDAHLSKEIHFLLIRLKKLSNLRGSSFETIGISMIEIKENLRNRDLGLAEENLEKIDRIIGKHEDRYWTHQQEYEIPPDIIRSQWHYLFAELKKMQSNQLQAYDHYVLSLHGRHFNPSLHSDILSSIQNLLKEFQINYLLKNFQFYKQAKKRQCRQYIFLIDVSNPAFNSDQRRIWSKQCSQVAEYIFNNYIQSNDRVSINEFHANTKIKCNLVAKKNQEKLLKNDLRSSFRSIRRQSYPQTLKCLAEVISRVDHLQSQKYFIIFLKKQVFVDTSRLTEICKESHNSVFVFITENECLEPCPTQNYFVLNPDNIRDIDRILEQKVVRYSDNKIYVF